MPRSPMTPARWWWPVLAMLPLVGGLVVAARLPSPWNGWRPATCMPDACFCETVGAGLVRQPANAVSGLAFVLVALWIVAADASRGTPPARRNTALLFAGALAFLGMGTAFYHASLTFAGQTVDVLVMYLLVLLVGVLGLVRYGAVREGRAAVLYMASGAALLAMLLVLPHLRRPVFAGLVLGVLALEAGLRRRGSSRGGARYLAGATALLLLGFGVWILDQTGAVCAPGSPVQGHAIWHLFGAAAAGLLYLYLRSAEDGGEDRLPTS
jgi:hypothetical protein